MEFRLLQYPNPLVKLNEVPDHYKQFNIANAKPLCIRGAFGDYLTQIIRAKNCRIQLNIFNILVDILAHPYMPRSVIPLHFTLKGNIKCYLEGFGEAWLIEKCANLFYVPGKIHHKAWFKPGFYKSFHIDFSPRILMRLATKHPELKEVLTRFSDRSIEGVRQHTSFITPEIQKIIKQILYFHPDREPELSTFTEIKSKELLLKYVQNTPLGLDPRPKTDKEFIDQIAAFIGAHLDYPFTIKLLGRTFAINETTLKRRFKQYTGQTIYAYLTRKRMEYAMKLLESGVLVGDIAGRVGYHDFSSFDRSFRHYFGHSPAFYRRK